MGLILAELERHGSLGNTLIIYFADNGIPFPRGKTNLYEMGQAEPLIVVNPAAPRGHRGVESAAIVSSLDLAPTMLDGAGLNWRACTSVTKLGSARVTHRMQGQSLLPLTTAEAPLLGRGTAFGSHTYHITEAF